MAIVNFSRPYPKLVDFLLTKGWRRDERRNGLTTPEGLFVAQAEIDQADGQFLRMLAKEGKLDKASDMLDAFATAFNPIASPHRLPLSSHSWADPPAREKKKKFNPYTKLKMRLDMEIDEEFGFHCNIVVGPNKVHVFVAKDDKALVLEDDPFLYPSDKLIGQVRLFQGSIR